MNRAISRIFLLWTAWILGLALAELSFAYVTGTQEFEEPAIVQADRRNAGDDRARSVPNTTSC